MSKTKKKAPVNKKHVALLICLILLVYGGLGYTFYLSWLDSQPVFRDVTVELGTESLGLRSFLTDAAIPERAAFVSDPSVIDLGKVGTTEILVRHGNTESTVKLTVQDTTAPTATAAEPQTVPVDGVLPGALDLVSNVFDLSPVKVYYAQDPVIPEDYSSISPVVVLEDAHGNKTELTCTLSFTGWVKPAVILELGTPLTADLILTDPQKDSGYVNQSELDAIASTVGTHTLTVKTGSAEESCAVTVQDTTAPVLTLNTVRRMPGETVSLADFVSFTSDLSGQPQVRLTADLPDMTKEGKHTITVEASDAHGNKTTQDTILWVSRNQTPPEIKGVQKTLTMEKHSSPDFLEGITATDDIDGSCIVTVDTGALNTAAAGTYYITYSSVDNSGNVGTAKRKVEVLPNEEDTAALVAQLADALPNDPEAIRDFVRESIAYSSNWGGDDPVWYGLTTNTGNCYVHALTLQAMLTHKGYETQLIWVTNKSHYWLIIKLGDVWRHIDSTPSPQHMKVSLMTDRDRYLNLNGRNWDRKLWPACE